MSQRRRPYWLLVAFVVLMLSPLPWSRPVLVAAAVGVTVLRAGLQLASRRARAAADRAEPGAIVLGAGRAGTPVSLSDRELSAHGLILGASGAGKSTTLLRILTGEIRRGRPVVAIDMKGSPAFAAELGTTAAAAGRPFRLWTPDGPSHWNPLAHGGSTELKDKLIATERFTEPHYQRAAERYMQTALAVLAEARSDRPPTLQEVVDLMSPQKMPSMLRNVRGPLVEQVQDYLAGMTPDQLSAVRGLGTRLAIITESQAGPYLSPPPGRTGPPAGQTIDLREALDGSEVVLFSLNSSTYGKLAAQIGTLVVQDLVSVVGHRLSAAPADSRALNPAIVGIDEFSALGADHVIALLARGREAGVATLLATQELADLDRAAPGLRDQVLGNTAVKIAHRQDVPSSAQTVAQMAGTEKAWEETHQLGRGPFGRYTTGGGTRREVEQFIVHPNEIKTLGTGDAVLISKLRGDRARTVHVMPPGRTRDGPLHSR